MKDSLRQRLQRLQMRLRELDANLADPQVASDINRYRALSKEHSEASLLVDHFLRFEQRERDWATAQELLADERVRNAYLGD